MRPEGPRGHHGRGKRHCGRGRGHHDRRGPHRALQNIATPQKDLEAGSLAQVPPTPTPEPTPAPVDINPITGLPHQYDAAVHSLLEKQRDLHLKKFNIMFNKERWVTFMTVVFFNHRHHCCGFLIFWVLILPLICCCMAKKMKKKMYRMFRKLLDIENSTHFRKFGYVWSINTNLTELTLNKVSVSEAQIVHNAQVAQNVSYPTLYSRAHPFDSPESSFDSRRGLETEGQVLVTDIDRVPIYASRPVAAPVDYRPVANVDQSVNYGDYQ